MLAFWARSRAPLLTCAIIGLGGLFAGVTGPLLSAFVPAFVQDALGTHRAAIGGVMAIDNILLLVLVPLAGAASDRASTRGSGRLRIVIVGFVLAAIGMLLFPLSPRFGLAGIIAAMIALYSGINIQRAPFQSLLADAVPSRYRSLASGSVTFQMCAGAILFLMLGRTLGAQTAFTIAAVTVVVIAVAMGLAVRETETAATDEPSASLWTAIRVSLDGSVTGMRQIFLATLLLQMTFQMFTTWYALHGMERFGVGPEEVTTGFIAWAVGGVIGALPAGVIGGRIGRRNTMLLGFATLALCLVALDRVSTVEQAVPWLALASASWTLPTVNAYPLFVEPLPRSSRGLLTAVFLLCTALGGAIGDPLNGVIFETVGSYRPLFLMMAGYTVLAAVAVSFVPSGTGEAETGPAR